MTVYTMRLSDLIDVRGGHTTIDDNGLRVLDKPAILHLDKYPIFDEAHRPVLNSLILDTYWNREIAHETADIFIGQLRMTMQRIMPTYNKVYESTLLDFDPLVTTDITVESKGTSDSTSDRDSTADSTSTQDGESRSVAYDTPSQALKPDGHYASAGTDGKSASTTTSTASDEASARERNESEGSSRTVGYAGSPAALVQAYRESILNVDELVVEELEPLFFMLWGSPHTFHHSNDWI